jgi:hypothetical protein
MTPKRAAPGAVTISRARLSMPTSCLPESEKFRKYAGCGSGPVEQKKLVPLPVSQLCW